MPGPVEIKVVSTYDAAGIHAAQKSMQGLSSSAGMGASGFGKAMKGIGIAAAVGGAAVAGVGAALFQMGQEAQNSLGITRSTEAILKSTGASAWTTSGQIGALADSISKKTGMDDEAVQSAQNLLLTFKNVQNAGEGQAAMFDRATQAAADLSAAGFGSLDSTAKQLGKALNDPTKGLGALSKAGVTFTDQQKDQIKALQESGDLLGAQAIVMQEVESQVSGVAEAAASPFDKLNVMLGNFKETVGMAVLPAITNIVDAIGPILEQLSGPLGQIAGELGGLFTDVFAQIGPLIPPLVEALSQVISVLAGGLLQAVMALIPALTPLLSIIGDLATRIAPILAPILAKVGAVLGDLLSAVMPLIGPLMDLVMNILGQASPILDMVIGYWDTLVGVIKPILAAVSNLIPPLNLLINVVFAALVPVLEPIMAALEILVGMLGDELVRVIGVLLLALGGLILGLSKIAPFMLENVTKPTAQFFLDMVGKVLNGAQALVGWVPLLKDPLADAVSQFNGLAKGVTDGIQTAADMARTQGQDIGQSLADSALTMIKDPSAAQAAGSTFGGNIATGIAGQQKAAYDAGALLRDAAIEGIGNRQIADALKFQNAAFKPATTPTVSKPSSTAKKPEDPFKKYMDSLRESVAQVKMKARLIANGVPEALADSIIGADGWKTVADRLLKGGKDALAAFIKMWTGSQEGKDAISSVVDSIVEGAKKQAERLKKALEDFRDVQRGFVKDMMSNSAISNFKPSAGVPITAEGISAFLSQRLQILREFNSVMSQLQNPGSGMPALNRAALLDIYGMGPVDGLAYAKAILAGGASVITDLNTLQQSFVTPATLLGTGYAQAATGTTEAALTAGTNFQIQAGGVQITVNGEVTQTTIDLVRDAVVDAFTQVGNESRAGRRTGVR